MRTLELNKQELWFVEPTGTYTEKVDDDLNFTGERIRDFTSPVKIRMMLYPDDGTINNDFSGKLVNFDFYSVTTDLNFSDEALLFYNEPLSNFDTTYDLKVEKILKSLNSTTYLFKSR